ncbi:SAM hydroxide adenosyltransferase [Synechococcus sp. PCC 7336]|uniref:SAM hydroxide adenosyltransferase n=1 Tax=Synechococcus sp. PCC 7336 TaxID=195250 RepID=UPI00034D442B|nr:SAM hydroxide adenosyltransferase [Synechococcus sp. PCC 7336]
MLNFRCKQSPNDNPDALAGSHGWVEIAVNGGNARDRLRLDYGVKVEVKLECGAGV